jgi:hypothetical protein
MYLRRAASLNQLALRRAHCPIALLGLMLTGMIASGCGQTDAAASLPRPELSSESAPGDLAASKPSATPAPVLETPLTKVESLRRRGQFAEYVAAAKDAAAADPADPALCVAHAEALAAGGDLAACEQLAATAARLSVDANESPLAVQALRLWITARLRQAKNLDSAEVTSLVAELPTEEPGADLLRFWCDAFSAVEPYRIEDAAGSVPSEVSPTRAAAGTIWADLNAIEARAGGAAMPMVFIDTGAQHTVMTRRAAEQAGVNVDQSDTQLIGFSEAKARPGVLDTLELGELTLHNVPVLVADSPPLVTANGQMALGTELMHHVRFTLDYPARRVFVERASEPYVAESQGSHWQIPLWTFSQSCVARGELEQGGAARVLVDTGNRTGTFVSARWARQHLAKLQRPTSTLVFKFKHQNLTLDTIDLGGTTLRDWPILDRLPNDLERLDLVDVLLGRDLLWAYRLTIDLPQRVLYLEGGPDLPAPPQERIP